MGVVWIPASWPSGDLRKAAGFSFHQVRAGPVHPEGFRCVPVSPQYKLYYYSFSVIITGTPSLASQALPWLPLGR